MSAPSASAPGAPILPSSSPDEPAPLLDLVVYPHRSLGPTGFLVLMAVLCGCSFAVGLAFFLSGAWPVVGFLGVDVAHASAAREGLTSGVSGEAGALLLSTARRSHACLGGGAPFCL